MQRITATFLLAFLLFISACKKENPPCRSGSACFKIENFDAQLKKRLDANCIGYGYVIGYKGDVQAFGSGGYQRLAQDLPTESFSVFDPMNPASLSKTITGIALVQELNSNGILLTDSIYKWLPRDWTFGANFKTITFKEILQHTSGIRSPQFWMDYPALKGMAATGILLANKTYQYDNSNYNIMRILIPVLNSDIPTGSDAQLSQAYGLLYQEYVNQHVFGPCNIPMLTCMPDAQNQSLCYQFPANGGNGTDFGDWTIFSGGAGWNISPLYFSSVVRHLLFTEDIMPYAVSKSMVDSLYAFDSRGTTPGFGVNFVQKNGYFPGGNNPGEFNGETFVFSNGVTLILYVNSQLNYNGGIYQLVLDAFDAAG